MKKTIKLSLSVVIAGSLILAPVQQLGLGNQVAYAAASDIKAFSGMKVKTFKLTSKSTIEIKDVMFHYGASTKRVFFTVTYYNGDSSTLDVMDYWVQLNSKNGANYKLVGAPSNPADLKVAPKTSKQFTYYADVDTSLKYTDFKFKVMKWDFGAPNYTKSIGEAPITSTYVNKVPANQYYVLKANGNKVKSSIKGANTIDVGNTNEVQIKLNLTNQSNTAVATDYKYYLRTKSGLVISLNTTDPTLKEIGVNESSDITLISQVNKKIDLTGAELLLTKVDGKDSLEIPLSNYAVVWSKTSSLIVAQNKKSTFNVEDSKVEMTIGDIYSNKGNSTNDIVLNMKVVNKGNQEIKLPDFSYDIKMPNGKVYKATSFEKELTLLPDKVYEISINAEVPSNITGKMTLLINQPKVEGGAPKHVKSGFILDAIKPSAELNTKVYTSSEGSYQFTIDTIERLPWGEEDIINVYLQVSNVGKETSAIPKLTGTLALNGIDLDSAKAVWTKLDSQIMIEPKQKTKFVVSMKVPYTYKFSKVNLKIQDQISKDKIQTVANFTSAKIKGIVNLPMSSSHAISSAGRQSQIKIDRMYKFEGNRNNLVYVDVMMTNKELRSKILPALKAHFTTATNEVYSANIVDVKTKVNSNENAVVTIAAELPKSVTNYNDLSLIIGEAMLNGAYSETSKDADGFINAVGFDVDETVTPLSTDLRNIVLPTYDLDIRSVDTTIKTADELSVGLNYTLSDNNRYGNSDRERKLVIEIKTESKKFEQVVVLGDKGMKVGNLLNHSISFSGESLASQMVNGYTLNVYEEYEGYKRLVGSSKINTFSMAIPHG